MSGRQSFTPPTLGGQGGRTGQPTGASTRIIGGEAATQTPQAPRGNENSAGRGGRNAPPNAGVFVFTADGSRDASAEGGGSGGGGRARGGESGHVGGGGRTAEHGEGRPTLPAAPAATPLESQQPATPLESQQPRTKRRRGGTSKRDKVKENARVPIARAVIACYSPDTREATLKSLATTHPGVEARYVRGYLGSLSEGLKQSADSNELGRAVCDVVAGLDKTHAGRFNESGTQTYTERERRDAISARLRGTLSQQQCENTYGVSVAVTKRDVKQAVETLQQNRSLRAAQLDADGGRRLRGDTDELERCSKSLRDASPSEIEIEDATLVLSKEGVLNGRRGPPPALSPETVDTLLRANSEAANMGFSRGLRALGKVGATVAASVGGRDAEIHMSQTWVSKARQQAALRGTQTSLLKPQCISQGRARARQPWLTDAFFDKLEALYEKHQAAGRLLGAVPEPHQLFNFDEVGVDSQGCYRSALVTRQPNGAAASEQGAWRLTTGEHSTFWTTMGIVSRADCSFPVPPLVIKSSAKNHAEHKLHLPSNWTVLSSPSGFLTRDISGLAAQHIAAYSRPLPGQMSFYFVDGYDSHHGSAFLEALMYKRDLAVDEEAARRAAAAAGNEYADPREQVGEVIYLRSMNSSSDQPNDCGPNAAFKARVTNAFANFSEGFPTLPMTPPRLNIVLNEAWSALVKSGGNAVATGWSKTGLYPLNRHAENFKGEIGAMGRLLDPPLLKDSPRDVGTPTDDNDGRDGASEGATGDDSEATVRQPAAPQEPAPQQMDLSLVTPAAVRDALASTIDTIAREFRQLAGEGDPANADVLDRMEAALRAGACEGAYKAVCSEQARRALEKSVVAPAQSVKRMLDMEKAAKKLKTDPAAADAAGKGAGQNPDTRAGLVATQGTVDESRLVETHRLETKDAKATKMAASGEKKATKLMASSTIAVPILASLNGVAACGVVPLLLKCSRTALVSVLTYLKIKYENASHAKVDLSPGSKPKSTLASMITSAVGQLPGGVIVLAVAANDATATDKDGNGTSAAKRNDEADENRDPNARELPQSEGGVEVPESDDDDEFVDLCQVCGGLATTDGCAMLKCDGCMDGYHLGCLTPPLSRVPDGDWWCPQCLAPGSGAAVTRATAATGEAVVVSGSDMDEG